MPISLGRDCTISVNGSAVSARDVTVSETTEDIDVQPFGSREICKYTTGYSVEVTVESIDDSFYTSAVGWCEAGTEVELNGTGFSFNGVVSSVSFRQPLDDVCSYTAVFRKTYLGLR